MIPFLTMGTEPLLRAELLAELGRKDEALEWLASLGKGFVADVPLLPLSHLRRAELHQRLGNREEADRHFQQVAALWAGADPSFHRLLEETDRQSERPLAP